MHFSLRKIISLFERSTTPYRPYHVQWFITQECNYRCRGCNVWRSKREEKELVTEEVKEGLDVLRKVGAVEIVFSGGNPLLRNDIEEIIDYSSKYFITTIYDNGSMALEKIDALRKVDFVAISLDSLDERRNENIKGVSGAWKKTMDAVMQLHSEGISVGVSPTISQFNVDEIVDFTKHFIDLDIPVWYCLYWYDQPKREQLFKIGKRVDEFEIADRKKFAAVCDALRDLKKKHRGIFITERTLETLKHLILYGERKWKCRALQSFLTVDPQGRVAGCHLQEPVTSIFELSEEWKSEKFQKLRGRYERCSRCAYLCYIFYSLYSDIWSNMEILFTQGGNIKLLIDNLLNGRNRAQAPCLVRATQR